MTMRREEEIRREHNRLDPEAVVSGRSQFPGMSYEQGLDDAVRWILGDDDDNPFQEFDSTAED